MKAMKKRKRYFIFDPKLQYKFLAIVLIYSLIIVGSLAIALFLPDILKMMDESLSPQERGAAAERMLSFHARVWPTAIALVCLIGIHSIRTFHRIIGALYRFRWIFARIGKGDLSCRLRLRKKDYLHREEEMFNEMLAVLKEKWESARIIVQDALKSLDNLERSVTEMGGWREEDRQLLQNHRNYLEALADHVRYFRLEEEEELEQEKAESPA